MGERTNGNGAEKQGVCGMVVVLAHDGTISWAPAQGLEREASGHEIEMLASVVSREIRAQLIVQRLLQALAGPKRPGIVVPSGLTIPVRS